MAGLKESGRLRRRQNRLETVNDSFQVDLASRGFEHRKAWEELRKHREWSSTGDFPAQRHWEVKLVNECLYEVLQEGPSELGVSRNQ